MPPRKVESADAAARNAAPDTLKADAAASRPPPRRYAAPDVADSSLAPPAAGEIPDYMDEGDALGAEDVQSGSDHRNRPGKTQAMTGQGRKTLAGNRERFKFGSVDSR